MAVTNFTSLLGLALPTEGDLDGIWGTTVNDSITTLLDTAVAGTTTLSTDTDVTLSTTNGATNQSRAAVILWTATGTTTRNITAQAQSKVYVVINKTGGTQNIVLRGAGPTTGITVIPTEACIAVWNGVDFVKAASGYVPSGVLKGSAGSLAAATAGTDYVAPGTATTFTATQTFSGSATTVGAVLKNAAETVTVSATAATGTINYDALTQSVLYYTSNASANWTISLRGDGTTSLNTLLSTGQAITVVHLVTQGTTAYYNSSVQVDGTTSGVTTKWQGVAPTAGNPSGVDAYTYTVIKTGSAAFTVLASQTPFV
jgi:hypothetical protein